MRHLDDGALRRLIDEPLAAGETERHHLAECPTCLERSRNLKQIATAAAGLLSVAETEPNAAAALGTLRGRLSLAPSPQRALARLGVSFRPLVRPAMVAAAMLLVTAVGVAATPSLLPFFQSGQVTAVPVSVPDRGMIAGLPDLSNYGTVEVVTQGENASVLTAAEAKQLTGLTPPAAPADYAGKQVTYQVIGKSVATFTFSAEKARAAALAAGKPAPDFSKVPGIDRTKLTVTLGPAVAAVFGTIDKKSDLGNLPLVIAVSEAPQVTSSGASVKELENFLIAQPGIAGNPELIAQIRSIGDPLAAGDLVIPVPANLATSKPALVNGARGVMISEKTGLVRAVVWQKNEAAKGEKEHFRIYAVAGHFDAEQILSLATSLKG